MCANSSIVNRQFCGWLAECLAEQYLLLQGLAPWYRNWRGHQGEIDIIARDNTELVCVEVRLRRTLAGDDFAAYESVDAEKQRKIQITGEQFWRLHEKRLRRMRLLAVRHDIIAVDYRSHVLWLRGIG